MENPLLGWEDNRAVTELGFSHFTTKTWAYSSVLGFFRKKIWQAKFCPPHQITLWKYNGKSIFKTFLIWTKTLKNFFYNCDYIGLYEKTAFGLNFGLQEVPQPENWWKHTLSLSCIFRLGHFPKSKIESKSSFLIKSYIIIILICFGAVLSLFNNVKKKKFQWILGPPGNHASRWIRDLWSKGVLLILANF